mgnify:CR=1 FL=1
MDKLQTRHVCLVWVSCGYASSHSNKQKNRAKMAAVKSQKPLPLLRRPLPPKSSPLPPIKHSSTVSTSYDSREINSWSNSQNFYPESKRENRSVNNLSQRMGEPEHFVYGRTTLHTGYYKRGPDPLPARQPRKPREPPPEAIMRETFVKPPPKFTLRDFLRKKRSASLPKVEKMAFPVVSKQNYEKYENFTSWYNGDWEQKTAVHSFDIDSKLEVISFYFFLLTDKVIHLAIVYVVTSHLI